MTRPQGAGCDIGAFETGPIIPVVTASNPSANATLTSLTTINVTFNQDMKNDGSSEAANTTANYLLVERGTNGTFDTLSCNGGLVADDVPQTINTANYNNLVFMSTLTLANPLTNGTYRLSFAVPPPFGVWLDSNSTTAPTMPPLTSPSVLQLELATQVIVQNPHPPLPYPKLVLLPIKSPPSQPNPQNSPMPNSATSGWRFPP
ncbi:MAG: hypothetical protein IPJ47_17890 [Anaerolineales bacterium]|nr:hypothetical protein [Anaerolineales bacterium]